MTKISIVGAGFVGTTCAYALLLKNICREITLIDLDGDRLEGNALDLQDGISFSQNTSISYSTNLKLTKDSDIIIITAGIGQKKGQSRLELVEVNAKIIKSILSETKKYSKNPIYLIVSNPVDILTYVAKKVLPKQADNIFGTGTCLDTSRLRKLVSSEIDINPKQIHAHILGEHGDNSFAAWSQANVSGIPLKKFSNMTDKKLTQIENKVKTSAYEIIAKKGSTYYAIGIVVSFICKSILENKSLILPLSTIPKGYGINNMCVSVPCVVDRTGIKKILKNNLSTSENKKLNTAAKKLREHLPKEYK